MRLYGKRSIIERIQANPKSVKVIYIQDGIHRPEVFSLARKKGIRVESLPRNKFMNLAHKIQTQGVIADVDKFYYRDFEEIISGDDNQKPILIFLDRINDPQNLGVILRSCACFGGFAIVLPKFESVDVTDAVLKVACGAENYIPVTQVVNLSLAIQKAKEAGYWIGATVVKEGENPRNINLNFPLGLVFGSEGEGVRPGLMKHIDYKLTLPMEGIGLSFNVAMAVTVFCYEAYNQRQNHGKQR